MVIILILTENWLIKKQNYLFSPVRAILYQHDHLYHIHFGVMNAGFYMNLEHIYLL